MTPVRWTPQAVEDLAAIVEGTRPCAYVVFPSWFSCVRAPSTVSPQASIRRSGPALGARYGGGGTECWAWPRPVFLHPAMGEPGCSQGGVEAHAHRELLLCLRAGVEPSRRRNHDRGVRLVPKRRKRARVDARERALRLQCWSCPIPRLFPMPRSKRRSHASARSRWHDQHREHRSRRPPGTRARHRSRPSCTVFPVPRRSHRRRRNRASGSALGSLLRRLTPAQ